MKNESGKIEVGYGGADGSFKHVYIAGPEATVADLLEALYKAQKDHIRNVCIGERQFGSLIAALTPMGG